MDEIWYRFQDKRYSVVIDADREEYGSVLEVELYKYYVVKTTPKGVRIALYKGQSNPRFVLRDATKRFACPTILEAWDSFVARKRKQAAIHRARSIEADRAIDIGMRKFHKKLNEVLLED